MRSRAEIVDENFSKRVQDGALPDTGVPTDPQQAKLFKEQFLEIFTSQVTSRHLDYAARILKKQNLSFYTISSAGHEGNAAVAQAFRHSDMAFLHYRSGGFFVQRSRQLPGTSPIWDVALSLVASADDPISGGRHKVFGSVDLNIPPQTSTIASHLPKAVGAALSVCRARDLGTRARMPADSVVVCSFGDASFNHASAQAALNTTSLCAFQNLPVPIVFLCEDNGLGISVKTPIGWVQSAVQGKPGFRYISCDGRSLSDTYRAAQSAVDYCRKTRRPVFLHMQTVRLLGHAGSDVESLYHGVRQIEAAEADDPLLHGARTVLENGWLSKEGLLKMYEDIRGRVMRAAWHATERPKLTLASKVRHSVVPIDREGVSTTKWSSTPCPPAPKDTERQSLFGGDWKYMERSHHMAKLLNWALVDILARYSNTLVFGEDVAKKGGVYHVTSGLWKKFGQRRVFNSPLDETSILGTAIGMAQNGFVPIPEIQFLAYLHNAEDQLRGEAATLSFFSKGQYTNPMVIRIAGLAYQRGFGGHFHNDNSLAVLRDIPGVAIACPSNGADAVKMLRTAVRLAYEQGRVCVFLEPIALYMMKDLHEPGDGLWLHKYPDIGEEADMTAVGVQQGSKKLAIVTYGNGVYLTNKASSQLEQLLGEAPTIVDLKWLAPVPEASLLDALQGVDNVLIVDECRKTGGQNEALMALIAESMPEVALARHTADDCFIPLGAGATSGLPSCETIVEAASKLLRSERVYDAYGTVKKTNSVSPRRPST